MSKEYRVLKLVKPSKKYLHSFLKVMDDYKKDKNHFGRGGIDPLIKAIEENKIDEYLKKLADGAVGKNLTPGHVPGTRFWLLDDDEFVGSFEVRHALTPNLERVGGHVAANIAPKYRGKYSSFIGIKMCIDEARKLGLKRVLMTYDASNKASYRVWINTTK